MHKHQLSKEQILSDEERQDYLQLLKLQLSKSKQLILKNQRFNQQQNNWHVERNLSHLTFREDKIFTLFTAEPPVHFSTCWLHLEKLYPQWKKKVIKLTQKRIKNVMKDLLSQTLTISQRPPLVPYHYEEDDPHSLVKEKSEQIRKKLLEISCTLQEQDGSIGKSPIDKIYSPEKKKQTLLWIQKNKEEKQERRKRLQQLHKKQQQQFEKSQKQKKELQQSKIKAFREQILRKKQEYRKKRDEQKILREQRNSEYIRIRKDEKQKPRLFQRLRNSYSVKKQYEENEQKNALRNDKRQRYCPIEDLKIEEHQQNYEEILKKKNEQRMNRMEMLSNSQKSRIRYHSSFQFEKRKLDRSEIERQIAQEKANKMKDYQMILKEKYIPKISENKKKQLQMLVQEQQMNENKKYKRIALETGKILYQEIKQKDTRAIGIEYLEMTKQMANKARSNRSLKQEALPLPEHKKTVDYLEHYRKYPRPKPPKLQFIDRKNLSYQQKMEKVAVETQKLRELAKANEDKLKYGKFQTSEEILSCKQQIDNSYIDIAFMKLRMIKQGADSQN